VLYFDPSARRAWLYSSNGSGRQWISALCYRKALWRENRFSPIPRGEDTRFVWNRAAQSPLVLPDHRFFVATLHAENTSSRMSGGACWARRPLDEVRQLLGADYWLYEAGDDARAEHG